MAAVSWKSAVSGNWTTAADWSTGKVPGAADDATIGVAGFYTVSLTSSVTVSSLTISDPGATLAVAAKDSLTAGSLINTGTIDLTGGILNITGSGGGGGGGGDVVVAVKSPQAPAAASSDATNDGTLVLAQKASATTSAGLVNNGMIDVAANVLGTGDAGGSTMTIGGTLTNNGDLDIGNSGLTVATAVTATGLSNTALGTINLIGDTARATLDITGTGGAAPATLTGAVFLQGDALLEFASGHIATVATNTVLSLDGAKSFVALSSAPTSNSALTLLHLNDGVINLQDHASIGVTSTTAFQNFGSIFVDLYGDGGSSLKLAGSLNNTINGDIEIGSDSITAAATLIAAGLTDTGTVYLTGAAGRATLDITGAAFATVTNTLDLFGNALLEFGSGSITAIADSGALVLDGPWARIALSGDTSSSGALAGLAGNAGTFTLADGASVATSVGLANSGTTSIDRFFDSSFSNDGGGSSLSIGGTLNNSDRLEIGNENITAATTVTAAGLSNTGSISLEGSAGTQATLNIAAVAPTALTAGEYELSGDALLEYASGSIGAIDAGVVLSLDGTKSRVASGSALGSNTALTGLTSNAGSFTLADGAKVTTAGGLTNTDFVAIDESSAGGSSLTVGGTLSNVDFLEIGNAGITAAVTVTAAGLANTGTIELNGGTATQATLKITGTAPTALKSGRFELSGDALWDYSAGGAIAAIDLGVTLSLDGAKSRVASGSTTAGNTALATLASNAGSFSLANGAAVSTTANFANTGTVEIDSFGSGGSKFTIGGTLTNSAALDIGNAGIATAVTVTAAGLANTATIDLAGGTARATLDIGAAAPSTLSGILDLSGNALLEFKSGSITAIGSGADLSLNGPKAFVAANGKLGSNTALTGLAGNAGTLVLENGAALTTPAFTNTGSMEIDEFGSGGSSLKAGGTLTNNESLDIGNSALTAATTVTAAGFTNSGSFEITSGTAAAKFTVTGTGTFTNTGSVAIDEFGSGGSRVAIGGTLANGGFSGFDVGNADLTTATNVTAAGLTNAGTIELTGGAALATLDIGAAAPPAWAGALELAGNALLEFKTGSITAIGPGAEISLNGPKAFVAVSGKLSSNSALAGLASNAGTFVLENGASLTLTAAAVPAFTNSSIIEIDDFGSSGGSRLTLGGTLTSSDFLGIGNSGITAATAVSVAGFTNRETFELTSGAAAAKFTVTGTGTFTNSDFAEIDTSGGGGSSLAIGGTLTSSDFFEIGNTGLTKATTVTAAGLANTGTIELIGGTARAALDIGAAAPLTWVGTLELAGDALLEFKSGGITAIGSGSEISLNGPSALAAVSGKLGSNSALTGLASNAGTLILAGGAALTTPAFTNTGFMEIDASGSGGSSLTVSGTLTNSDLLEIGNSGITNATTVTVTGALTNTGTIELTGGTAQASLKSGAAAPPTLTGGTFDLSGDALLEFTGGGITAIDSGVNISLNGAQAVIAVSGHLASNSALTGLASNAGTLILENGAALTTPAFTNSGSLEIDASGAGGSSFTMGGTLTNSDFLDIGNSGISNATKVTAAALANTGTVELTGSGTASATLTLAGASSDGGFMTVFRGGALALGGTLSVTESLALDGGTISGGTLSGTGTIETGFDQTGTLNGVTIAGGTTFTAAGDSTLTVDGVTVTGSITGSSGAALDFGQAGPDTMTNISGFATIGLATGSKANTLSLTDANFTGVFGPITVNDGNSGNTVGAAGVVTPGHDITINAGTGLDKLTGGAGTNQFYAGGDTTMTGGSGLNEFIFTATGSNTIANFGALATNELVFSDSGFNLGIGSATPTPTMMTTAEVSQLFTANSTGKFANTSQRLAYDTANGELFSSTDGSGSSAHLITTLTNHPPIGASQLFFVT